jgi:hypothetical protein
MHFPYTSLHRTASESDNRFLDHWIDGLLRESMGGMPLKSMIRPIIYSRPFDGIDRTTGQISNLLAYLREPLLTDTVLVSKIFELIRSKKERFAMTAKTH